MKLTHASAIKRLGALGNAVVFDIVNEIFKTLIEFENDRTEPEATNTIS